MDERDTKADRSWHSEVFWTGYAPTHLSCAVDDFSFGHGGGDGVTEPGPGEVLCTGCFLQLFPWTGDWATGSGHITSRLETGWAIPTHRIYPGGEWEFVFRSSDYDDGTIVCCSCKGTISESSLEDGEGEDRGDDTDG